MTNIKRNDVCTLEQYCCRSFIRQFFRPEELESRMKYKKQQICRNTRISTVSARIFRSVFVETERNCFYFFNVPSNSFNAFAI